MSYPRRLVTAVLVCGMSVVLAPMACAGDESTSAGSQAGSVTGAVGEGRPDEGAPEQTSPDDGVAAVPPPDIGKLLVQGAAVPDSWVQYDYRGVTVHAPAGQTPSGYADEEVDIAIHPLADDTAQVGGEVEVWRMSEPATTEALLDGADCALSGTDLAFGRVDRSEFDRRPVTLQGHEAVLCEGVGGTGEHRLVVMAAADEEPAASLVRVAVRAPTRDEAEALLATALSGVRLG
ncbi:MAG: hypothetical protein EDR02_14130 [Actinobacteria bacterium]|nr:MAG: hypothetical protein EDR02_14130 [Actinomycetota bacterium]RIK03991.1 MAG: hypothetical protein DCC48_14905 [Acidobacteriota bacterium]